jgi:uncharacterized membrane protein YbhN (UPF0104 family)
VALSSNAKRNLSIAAAAIILAAAVYGLVHAFTSNWNEVRDALQHANWWLLALAIVVAVLAVALIGDRWHATLEALGAPSHRGRSLRWFFTGQIGKYAPGGVWHVVGQGELARRGGIPRRTAYASVMICTVVLVGAAALTVAVGAAIPRQADTPWWAVALGAAIVAALFEPHIRRRILRAAGITDPEALPTATLARLVVGSVPAWLAIGVASALVSEALCQDVPFARVMLSSIASWLVGIVTLPAPGGIGVREAVFATGLKGGAGGISSAAAALVALMARLVFVVADVVLFFVARFLRNHDPDAVSELSDPATSL